MLFEREGKLCINLKCEPMQAEFFRRVYVGVTPGYHMNKEHWNTVLPDSDVPTDTFYAMIQESYDRTRPKTCLLYTSYQLAATNQLFGREAHGGHG